LFGGNPELSDLLTSLGSVRGGGSSQGGDVRQLVGCRRCFDQGGWGLPIANIARTGGGFNRSYRRDGGRRSKALVDSRRPLLVFLTCLQVGKLSRGLKRKRQIARSREQANSSLRVLSRPCHWRPSKRRRTRISQWRPLG